MRLNNNLPALVREIWRVYMEREMKFIDTTVLLAVLALASPVAMPATVAYAAGIQTQMTTDANAEVDVVKAQVNDGIMTIIVMFRNTVDKRLEYDLNTAETYYIDKAANKKFHMLKDSKEQWVASDVSYWTSSSTFKFKVPKNGKKLVWMKFPAPAEGVETIDFSMPGILPFDGLKVSR